VAGIDIGSNIHQNPHSVVIAAVQHAAGFRPAALSDIPIAAAAAIPAYNAHTLFFACSSCIAQNNNPNPQIRQYFFQPKSDPSTSSLRRRSGRSGQAKSGGKREESDEKHYESAEKAKKSAKKALRKRYDYDEKR
jgi:hypothetical protein